MNHNNNNNSDHSIDCAPRAPSTLHPSNLSIHIHNSHALRAQDSHYKQFISPSSANHPNNTRRITLFSTTLSVPSILLFVRGSVAFLGMVICWLGVYYLITLHIAGNTVGNNLIYTFAGLLGMILTDSLPGNSGLGQIFYKPDRISSDPTLFRSIIELLVDKDVEELEAIEICRRKHEKPWQTNFRLFFSVYIKSLAAFFAATLSFAGLYVLMDEHFLTEKRFDVDKTVGMTFIGLMGMILFGCLAVESGIWGENNIIATRKLQILAYYVRCLICFFLQVVYWIGVDHIYGYFDYILPPTALRDAMMVLLGFCIISVLNTAPGLASLDEPLTETEAETVLNSASITPDQTPRNSIRLQHPNPPENNSNQNGINSINNGQNGGNNGHNNENNAAPHPPVHPPPLTHMASSLNVRQSELAEFARHIPDTQRPSRLKGYLRILFSLVGAMFLWEGLESGIVTHKILAPYNENDEDNSLLPATGKYFAIMLVAGFMVMLATNSFFSNAGVLPPIQISRGKPYYRAKQLRANTDAAKHVKSFRGLGSDFLSPQSVDSAQSNTLAAAEHYGSESAEAVESVAQQFNDRLASASATATDSGSRPDPNNAKIAQAAI